MEGKREQKKINVERKGKGNQRNRREGSSQEEERMAKMKKNRRKGSKVRGRKQNEWRIQERKRISKSKGYDRPITAELFHQKVFTTNFYIPDYFL